MKKRVLCLLTDGFEEIEAITPVDLLRRAGAEVTLASLKPSPAVTGRCGVTVAADAALSAIPDSMDYDLLLIPGGPGVKDLREDGRAAHLASSYAAAGKLVGAICAAPTVLKDAGLLEKRRFTAHISVWQELPEALGSERVVTDEHIITSRGAGTALDFGLTLVAVLFGVEKREEIALSIMA